MTTPNFVSREDWLEQRRALLAKEKEFTKERDRLSATRRGLPLVLVDKDYQFDTNDGLKSLADLFGPKRQLAVYHFMYGEDWEEGCPSCSFWADNYERLDVHLAARDTKLLAISNASLDKLNAYKKRMGWSFDWVSTAGNGFGIDFKVTFPGKEDPSGQGYNFSETSSAKKHRASAHSSSWKTVASVTAIPLMAAVSTFSTWPTTFST